MTFIFNKMINQSDWEERSCECEPGLINSKGSILLIQKLIYLMT